MDEVTPISELLEVYDGHVGAELASTPDVLPTAPPISADDLYITARRWRQYRDVYVVTADLAGSTSLNFGNQWQASIASIYEAAVTPMVQILRHFDADFVAIQGDGGFGLFSGDRSFQRAICAGVTIKTFSSRHLAPALKKRWPTSTPQTGFKVGMAASTLLAKKVGIPRTDHNEPVWAGKAVNFAAKCAQQADRGEMIITQRIAERVKNNDYLAYSCGCNSDIGPSALWTDVIIDKIQDSDSNGQLLKSDWCEAHGDEFAANILAGGYRRTDIPDWLRSK
jgi:class 3 adenylate cyclase